MQAMEIKRFTVNRIGIAAIAIGTLTAGLVGAHAAYDAMTDRDVTLGGASPRVVQPEQMSAMRFLEWNVDLPTAGARVQSFAEARFLEQNIVLPSESLSSPQRFADIRLKEMNVLPGDDAAPGRSLTRIRFLEQNMNLPSPATTPSVDFSDIRLQEMNALPSDSAPHVRSFQRIRFLEQNTVLPAANDPYYPNPDSSRSTGAVTSY